MPVHGGVVLVDTNAIIEAHRVECWPALASRYNLQTVEKVVEEFNTPPAHMQNLATPEGFATFRASFTHVHPVSRQELAHLVTLDGPMLDAGEQHLWAHALGRTDAWILCGPDKASIKFGYDNGRKGNLTCLERLLSDIGHPSCARLRAHHGQTWLEDRLHKHLFGLI